MRDHDYGIIPRSMLMSGDITRLKPEVGPDIGDVIPFFEGKLDAINLARKLHKEEWQLLAESIIRSKSDALRVMGYEPKKILHQCFLCQYSFETATKHDMSPQDAHNVNIKTGRCKYCPVVWNHGTCTPPTGSHLLHENFDFSDWNSTDSISKKACVAEKIRDLPAREVEGKKVLFDGLKIVESDGYFVIRATLGGADIWFPNLLKIFKDGSGVRLIGSVNDGFQTVDDKIQVI